MSAPVSVVIPTLEAAERIGPTLAAVAEGAIDGLVREVILADGGSSDAIAEIAETVGARLVSTRTGRGTQLAAGAAAARGEWLLFLHADTVLAPGWPAAVRRHIESEPGRAGYAALRFESTAAMARVTEGWANLRARLFALPYGDQALLVPRPLYDAVGGYPQIPLMEDVALVRAIGRGRLTRLGTVAVTSAERYERRGWIAQGGRNLATFWLWRLGADPERLARRYRR